MRLVEVDRQLLDRVDLVVQHHQPLRTIRTHLLGIENLEQKIMMSKFHVIQ